MSLGRPSVNDPRLSALDRASARELQDVIRALRQRIAAAEAVLGSAVARLDNLNVSSGDTTITEITRTGAAGQEGSVQFNDAGALDGSSALTFDRANNRLAVAGVMQLLPSAQPMSLLNGDVWTTALGLYARISDTSRGPFLDGADLVAGSNVTIAPITGGAYLISAASGGSVLVQAGVGITVVPLTGDAVQINNDGVLAIVAASQQLAGQVYLEAGANVAINVLTGNVIQIASAGVTSVNGQAGAITLVPGANVTIAPLSGGGIQIAASGGGGGVSSLNGETGPVTLTAGSNITITPQSGGAIQIASSGGAAGVSSFNGQTGSVSITAGTNIVITPLTGGAFQISASGGAGGVTTINGLAGDIFVEGTSGRTAVVPRSGNALGIDLVTSGVSPGTYPGATVTVDAYGRVTAISASVAVLMAWSVVGPLVLDAVLEFPSDMATATWSVVNYI